jgi:type I restriction enzyme M protein
MLDSVTKNRINTARDILVGKVPDPKSQVEQITIALIYKFMDDMDVEAEELGGKRTFFSGEYAKYSWRKIFDPRQSGYELLNLYSEAITKMDTNPGVPKLFRDIFKNAYLPYRDPETLKSFLKIINEFEYTHSEKLGDAFEFLLSILGSQGDAGQFRTPRHIIDFMVAIIDPKKNEVILDPACGTAGFLISSYKHIIKQNSSNYVPDEAPKIINDGTQTVNEVILSTNGYNGDNLTADERRILADNMHGYDISPDMVRLSLVNMYLHGVKEPQIFEYDSLTSEDHWNEYSDVILANPPFMSPKGGIRPHKRFSVQSNRSEVLFVDYIAEHLTQDGRAAVIVPEGIIFQSGTAYKQLRKMLVDKYLVGVISLPAGVFNPYSGVKTSILWLDKSLAKKTDQILFVKIENDGFDLGAQRRAIKGNDLPDALHRISEYKDRISFQKQDKVESETNIFIIGRDEISCNGDYNLSGERYKKKNALSKFKLVALGDICEFEYGYTDSAKDTGNTRFVRITDIDKNGTISEKGKKYIDLNEENKKYLLTRGDIIIARTGATYGKTAIYEGNEPSIFASFLIRIKVDPNLLIPKYIWLLTWSDKYWEQAQKLVTGGGQPQFNANAIKQVQIPLHPLHTQEEIITELESYQKIIEGARQVVENYEPRIDIDPTWEEHPLSDYVHQTQLGLVKDKSEQSPDNGIPYIKMNNITIDGSLSLNDIVFVNASDLELKKFTLNNGDFIYNTRNSPELVGKSTVYHGDNGKYLFNNNILRIRFNEKINPDFVNWILNLPYGKSKIHQIVDGTTSVAAIYQKNFLSLSIPVPSKEIQDNLVKRIDVELALVDNCRKLIGIFEQKIKDRIAKVWGE